MYLCFPITSRATRAALSLLAILTLGALGLKKERNKRNSPYTCAERKISLSRSISFLAMTARLSKNPFFNFGYLIGGCSKVTCYIFVTCLFDSQYAIVFSPDLCCSTSWISQISTKECPKREPSSNAVFVNRQFHTAFRSVSIICSTE